MKYQKWSRIPPPKDNDYLIFGVSPPNYCNYKFYKNFVIKIRVTLYIVLYGHFVI